MYIRPLFIHVLSPRRLIYTCHSFTNSLVWVFISELKFELLNLALTSKRKPHSWFERKWEEIIILTFYVLFLKRCKGTLTKFFENKFQKDQNIAILLCTLLIIKTLVWRLTTPPPKKEIKRGGNYGLKGMGEGESVNEDDMWQNGRVLCNRQNCESLTWQGYK